MLTLRDSLFAHAPAPLRTWVHDHVGEIEGLIEQARSKVLSHPDYQTVKVIPDPNKKWEKIAVQKDGKWLSWVWNPDEKRWGRNQVCPPDLVALAVRAGWDVFLSALDAPGATTSRTRTQDTPRPPEAPQKPPQAEVAPTLKRTTRKDLSPPSMEPVNIEAGDLVLIYHHNSASIQVVLIKEITPQGGWKQQVLATSRNIGGGNGRVMMRGHEVEADPEKPGFYPAPDFTYDRVFGDVFRQKMRTDAKEPIRPAMGGYMTRYYLEQIGVPFFPGSRIVALYPHWSSAGTAHAFDITGDASVAYVPESEARSAIEKAPEYKSYTPKEGDLLADDGSYEIHRATGFPLRLLVSSTRFGKRYARLQLSNLEGVTQGVSTMYRLAELLEVEAPDLTESNLKKYGVALVNKYLSFFQKQFALIPVREVYNRAKGLNPFMDWGRMDEEDKVIAALPTMKPPEIPLLPVGTRVLYKDHGNWLLAEGTEQPAPVPASEYGLGLNPVASPEKLRKLADGMENTIEGKEDSAISHQTPTARRARIAEGMRSEARALRYEQNILYALADGIERDDKRLSIQAKRIDSRVTLKAFLGYGYSFEARASTLEELASKITKTSPKEAQAAAKYVREEGGGYYRSYDGSERTVKITPQLADAIQVICKAIDSDPYGLCSANADFRRLQALGIYSKTGFDQAKAGFLRWLSEQGVEKEATNTKAQQIRDLEMKLLGSKIPGFFPTPPVLADDLVARAQLAPGMRVLEPSAGSGRLVEAIQRTGIDDLTVDAIEQNYTLRELLKLKGANLVENNFMDYNPGPIYDAIVMNPPFEDYQDVDHVYHAYSLLKPGGKLVAIMGEGPFFRSDRRGQSWRAWLDNLGGISEKLPSDAFKMSGTGVQTRIVEIVK